MCESVQKQKIFIRYFEGSRAHQFHLGYLVICITDVRGQSDAHVVRNVCVCVCMWVTPCRRKKKNYTHLISYIYNIISEGIMMMHEKSFDNPIDSVFPFE